MKFNHKILLSSLLLFLSSIIQSVDMLRDEFGKTELMRDIIFYEDQIALMKIGIDRLWNVCYNKESVVIGFYTDAYGRKQNKYGVKITKKGSCTDEDINCLKLHEKILVDYIDTIVADLRAKMEEPQGLQACQLNAHDNEGKTIINYCYTYKMYQLLMEYGAPFQLSAWVYFNPYTTLMYSAATAALVYGGFIACKTYYNEPYVNDTVYFKM